MMVGEQIAGKATERLRGQIVLAVFLLLYPLWNGHLPCAMVPFAAPLQVKEKACASLAILGISA